MPRSKARRSIATPRSRSLTPHQVVPTVQTPKPMVERVRSVPPSFLYSTIRLLRLDTHRGRVDTHVRAPAQVSRWHNLRRLDLAAAAPEHVGVGHRDAQRAQMVVD